MGDEPESEVTHFRRKLKFKPRSTFCFNFNKVEIQYAAEKQVFRSTGLT